jgi:hypothetical protein
MLRPRLRTGLVLVNTPTHHSAPSREVDTRAWSEVNQDMYEREERLQQSQASWLEAFNRRHGIELRP